MNAAQDQLSPLARLALAYAPARARDAWLTVLLLDSRLAGVVRTAREPMLAQLRLAWWRDRLGEDPAGWPKGEPLLGRLHAWGPHARNLVALVDGWEGLLGDPPLEESVFAQFAEGRAAALGALAQVVGHRGADPAAPARRWALADLALHLGAPDETALALNMLSACPTSSARGAMRPLAILGGLSTRAVRRGSPEALDGPGAVFAAIRLGITGG